jgi:hypothetical protein
MIETQLLVPCPACAMTPGLADNPTNQQGPGSTGYHKRGRWKGFPRSAMPLCRFCWGRKIVDLNRICECGMPALVYDQKFKVWSCGFDSCVKSAVWRLNRSPHCWDGL